MRRIVVKIGFREIIGVVFAAVMALVSLAGGAGAAVPVSSCTAISSPGEYVLNQSITNSGNTICINIISSNVVFDGAGYLIDGIDAYPSYGVYAYNSTPLTNVTVKNLKVTDWYNGIYYNNVQSGSIENNTASSDSRGIMLDSSSNNILINNTASSNNLGIGIVLTNSNSNTLTNNMASTNHFGMWIEYSNNNILANNTANSNFYDGIILFGDVFLSSSRNNTVTNNAVSLNGRRGIFLYRSSSNILTNNIVNLNSGTGIYFWTSSNNTFYNNYVNNSNNVSFEDNYSNNWNISKTSGTNIIGGPFLGGNFWANTGGTGFSQTCADGDSDGICDSSYVLASENIDYLPLTYPKVASLMEGDTNLNNHVTITDALLIAKYKAGLIVLTPDQLKTADTNDDGSVTVTDALYIAKWLADPGFPLWDAVKDSDMLKPVP